MTLAGPATESLATRLDALCSGRAEAIADAPSLYRDLVEDAPVLRYRDLVLFSRYDDVRAIVRDTERFSNTKGESSQRGRAFRSSLSGPCAAAFDYVYSIEGRWLTRLDGEQHTRSRAVAQRFFTPRRVAALATAAERYVTEALNELALEAVADWQQLAYKVPLTVVCDLLGAPHDDIGRIFDWSRAIAANFGAWDEHHLMAAYGAYREFASYVEGLIAAQRAAIGEGSLVSALIEARDSEHLRAEDVVGMFIVILLAGHETTSGLIGSGLDELLREREQWERLCREPALAGQAVEELLRVVSPVQWNFRAAVADTTFEGHLIEAGTDVAVIQAAANRDPRVFATPDRLDITASDRRPHFAFGHGVHFCLGAALARLEAQIALTALARRFPAVELADVEPAWEGGGMTNVILRRLSRLPVRLGEPRG